MRPKAGPCWNASASETPRFRWRWIAYEGDETLHLVRAIGMTPVVPPKANQRIKWDFDRKTYKWWNEIERLFRRIKGYLHIFTRFEKLDVMYVAFICLALIVEMIKR